LIPFIGGRAIGQPRTVSDWWRPAFRELEAVERMAKADWAATGRCLIRLCSYSCRRATTGSTLAALIAGKEQAAKAAAASPPAISVIVAGSWGWTP
jgi:hypothetical protein